MSSKKTKSVRLSKHVVPVKYEIQMKPDLKDFTFAGVETITLSISKSTKILTLHSKEIEIDTASIQVGKEKIFATKISYNEKKETADLVFGKNIETGKKKLTLVFKGILNDKMRGFYRSKYNIGDVEYCMATTQFEATDARRAFPCFDEPTQKAVFCVSLVVPKGKTAISNTLPTSIKEHEATHEIIKFSPTPKMSTYLLAFIVGDFEYIQAKTKSGVQVRVFTTPGKVHQARFALDVAVKALEFYEEYFNIAYPLPTLDMIAIPDFSSGAMENWGAITYRESALLVDPKHTSSSTRQWVALVIAHELAHQWFGNLVTMEWWTHLWLNEGFASYIEYLAVDKLFPEWDIWTQFSNNDLGVALRLDALANTHPIEIPVHHPDEIGEIFDEVSYSKGASVIRMLAGYLGEKDFRDGLRYYLKKHSYKNTETIHLWQAFEKVSKKPVAKMMHNWTSKPGYPVIKADIKNGQLNLKQERFFSSPISKAKSKDKTTWQVPLRISRTQFFRDIAQSDGSSIAIFQKKNMRVEKKFVSRNSDWFKINFGEENFHRTAYSKEILEKLKNPVSTKELSPRDRLGIIRDLFALSEAGVVPTTDALEFLKAYKNEDNYTVWLEIASGLARLEQMLAKNQTALTGLHKLTITLFSPTMIRLGWDSKKNEPHADTLLRSLVISRLGRAGDKKVIAGARSLWRAMERGEQIHPDIRGAIYATIATHGGMKEYKALVKRYKTETLHEEKNRIGNALGDFTDEKILCLTSHFAISSDVRIQDSISILSSIGANPYGRNVWFKCLKINWKMFMSRYGDGGMALSRIVKAISGSAEKKHLADFKKFFKTHDAPGAKRSIEQVLERLESNIAWLSRDGKKIEKFLK